MGPGVAVPRLLSRTGLKLSDLDIVEMHEGIEGQVACSLQAWEQGWNEPAIGGNRNTYLDFAGVSAAGSG